jgi:predicted GNAT family N-acyltransferase
MADATAETNGELQQLLGEVEQLRQRVQTVHQRTRYEDLEHADLGLQIVHHALEEVLEHTGQGGLIASTPDPEAHQQAEAWLGQVRRLQADATAFLGTHPSEDLETAIKALSIAEGSLHEVAERYE